MSGYLRFAPSPTGALHAGNARIALLNRLRATQAGARFLLRFDDTDDTRSRPEFAQAIARDLAWLGITWDAELRQSDRLDRYFEAKDKLAAAGRLYPCYETPQELEAMRRAAKLAGRAFVYDRRALKLTEAECKTLEAEGRAPHWRFRLSGEMIAWHDLAVGEKKFSLTDLSDPVVIRADGRLLYLLASTVDDLDHGVTEILRGDDHITNTAAQIDMFRALAEVFSVQRDVPRFAHVPLVRAADGGGLSKREGESDWTLAHLRDTAGYEPEAVAGYLAQVGTGAPLEAGASAPQVRLEELAQTLDLAAHGGGSPRLDPEALSRLNGRCLHVLPYDLACPRLEARGIVLDESLWRLVSPNLERLADASHWATLFTEPATAFAELDAEEQALARAAHSVLPSDPWDETTLKGWAGALTEATGKKGRGLFVPLRKILTGRADGPELAPFLALFGRTRTEARLLALLSSVSPPRADSATRVTNTTPHALSPSTSH